ncbi:MAG: 4Fe-4S dicluster domain-containing protein [Planctomycetota bacterium]
MDKVESKNLDSRFKYDVAAHPGGDNIKLCFACGTCTAGCPVAAIDDQFNPRRIIRQVLLGMRKEVLCSPVIWRCVQCYSCTAKCPQSVKFRDVMRALREMAVAEGYVDASIPEEIEKLDELSQSLRRDLVKQLVTDRAAYEKTKAEITKITKV